MNRKLIISMVFPLVVMSIGRAQPAAEQGTALTIYNENFAVVRQTRQITFKEGINEIKFTDVASAIDPTSVNFKCLSAPNAVSILEQNYEYDLVNTSSLLKRYIDKNVSVILKGSGADTGRQVSGQLLAAMDRSLILRDDSENIQIIDKSGIEEISLRKLPENLVTRPTLVWLAEAEQAGPQLCRTTYTTEKIKWDADYSALLSAAETELDFSGWVTINNRSGATYKDAMIKLIAGDVRRITEPVREYRKKIVYGKTEARAAFEEKAFMEYHLYTLGRSSTINNNQVKQIEFIRPAYNLSVQKLYIYERSRYNNKVQVKLEFENKAENGLGIALPKGKVRVFKKDPADDMLEFVGEDTIDHTPKDEKLSVYIGNAFDIVPEYTLVDSKYSRRMQWQKHKIEIRNRKDEPVTVFVDEKFPSRVNWRINKATGKYEKPDARTARFKLNIKADSTATLEYEATQTW